MFCGAFGEVLERLAIDDFDWLIEHRFDLDSIVDQQCFFPLDPTYDFAAERENEKVFVFRFGNHPVGDLQSAGLEIDFPFPFDLFPTWRV